jgi:putative transposase
MFRGFKTELKLNNKERMRCEQHAGVARHAWNWGLEICIQKLRANEKIPSAIDLHKLLVRDIKSTNEWYYEVSKWTPQQSLRNLETAFKRFWTLKHPQNIKAKYADKFHKKFLKLKKEGKLSELTFEHEKGFPKFKKKGANDSFYLEATERGKIIVELNRIKVPRFGWIKTHEKMWFAQDGIETKNVIINRRAGKWFIGFVQEVLEKQFENRNENVGVDIGIKTLATLSDGKTFANPKAYKKNKVKLSKLSRKLSRQYEAGKDKKDSKGQIIYGTNYKKTKQKIAKLHLRIANVRKDSTHKLTSHLVKSHDRIVIEDLNVSGMMKNHNLAGAIADGGFFEFKRQLQYKSEMYGCDLVIADKWFASSKTCSCCGDKKEKLSLRERTFNCEKCGISIDRDLNAAINLSKYAVSDTVKVCGDAKFHSEREVSIGEAGIRQQARDLQVSISS